MEFDELYIYADIKHIQRLNNWSSEQVSGYEIMLYDIADAELATLKVREEISMELLNDGGRMKAVPIQESYNQIFDWLNLQDMNVIIIILLMVIVSIF